MIKLLIDDNELGFMRAETIKRNIGIIHVQDKEENKDIFHVNDHAAV